MKARLWFGVLGAPLAWVAQFLIGYSLGLAACGAAGRKWGLSVDGWTLAATAAGAAVAVLATASAVQVYRATRDVGSELPGARIHFLSVISLTIAPLFLAIILMGGVGAVVLENFRQG